MNTPKTYSLYIPKYKDTKQAKTGKHEIECWPLPFEIGSYISHIKSIDTLIVAPGYLSCGPYKCSDFFNALEYEIYSRRKSEGASEDLPTDTPQSRPIEVGLLKGNNGYNRISGGKQREFDSPDNKISILELCSMDTTVVPDGLSAKIMVPKSAVEAEKENVVIQKDHRKQIFFVNSIIDGKAHPLSRFIYDNGKANLEEMKSWVNAVNVKAMCMGSSNFSYRTYFDKFDKGEADLMMFSVGGNKTDEDNKDDSEYLADLERRIQQMRDQFNVSDRQDPPNLYPFENMLSGLMLSEEVLMAPPSFELLLKSQLYDLLRHSLAL